MNRLLIVTAIPDSLRAFLLPFAYHFRAQGWRVDGMAGGISSDAECIAACDRVWDVPFSRHPFLPQNLLLAPQRVAQIVAQQEYDIVHVHMAVAAFVTRYALKNLRKNSQTKVIYTAHGFNFYPGDTSLKNSLFLTLEQLAGRWTDYLVVINREDEASAKHYHLVPENRLIYMPGIGIDLPQYRPDLVAVAEVERLRQKLAIATETPLFLCIAELIPRKRHRDLLKAFALAARPNACLAFAGDGLLKESLQQLAAELGVQDRVRFLGFRRDIATLIRASVATILVSEQEGLPRSIMESLSLETPVIGTDIRGIRELLEKDCGLIVPLGNIEEIAKAIAWIVDNPESAQAMGKRGREKMAIYDIQQILKLHETVYNQALESIKVAVTA